jgi:hypothetical protein
MAAFLSPPPIAFPFMPLPLPVIKYVVDIVLGDDSRFFNPLCCPPQ